MILTAGCIDVPENDTKEKIFKVNTALFPGIIGTIKYHNSNNNSNKITNRK